MDPKDSKNQEKGAEKKNEQKDGQFKDLDTRKNPVGGAVNKKY